MPDEGLPISKRMLRFLALNPEEVYRSQQVKKLKEHLKDIEENINKLSFGIDNGVDRIKEFCLDLKNKVQLKTEQAIEQLNEHSKEMIKEINEFQKDCIRSYLWNEKTNNEFKNTKQELEAFNLKWNKYLSQSSISDEYVFEAILRANELVMKAKEDLSKLDKFIFNGGEIKFVRNENKLANSVLGFLMRGKLNFESVILSNELMLELINLCQFPVNQKWKLIYRATRDGFGAADFHSKCDSYQNSLVVIKSTNGNVFGGYTEKSWHTFSVGGYKADGNALLFSFINQYNTKVVMKCTDEFAIYSSSECGPIFGGGYDLYICNNSNTSKESYSNLGRIYKHPNFVKGSSEAKSFLTGSYNFFTAEIEVYTK